VNNYKIFAALHEEAKEGWVWLPLDPDLATEHTHIRNPRNGRSIVCERRTADENFVGVYNSTHGTIRLPEFGKFIVINAWYRERLGIFDTKAELPLKVSNASGLWASYRSFRLHPSPAIRTSILLAVISLILGIIGFLQGALSLWNR
jgi:hypothetical protein